MFHERTNKILLLLKRKAMTTGLFSQTQKIAEYFGHLQRKKLS